MTIWGNWTFAISAGMTSMCPLVLRKREDISLRLLMCLFKAYMRQWTWRSPLSASLVTVLTWMTSALWFWRGERLGLTGVLTGDLEGVNSSSAAVGFDFSLSSKSLMRASEKTFSSVSQVFWLEGYPSHLIK